MELNEKIKCPSCDKKINKLAQLCIHCGVKLNSINSSIGASTKEQLIVESNFININTQTNDELNHDISETLERLDCFPTSLEYKTIENIYSFTFLFIVLIPLITFFLINIFKAYTFDPHDGYSPFKDNMYLGTFLIIIPTYIFFLITCLTVNSFLVWYYVGIKGNGKEFTKCLEKNSCGSNYNRYLNACPDCGSKNKYQTNSSGQPESYEITWIVMAICLSIFFYNYKWTLSVFLI